MDRKKLWDKCAEFHGHICGGLTIGYMASLYAMELLELNYSQDEEVICVSENDACGVDAIQVILGCSAGKGNLLFKMRGKSAYSFFNRKSGKSVRLVLKDLPKMSREESFNYLHSCEPSELFDVKEVTVKIPEKARMFSSIKCESCSESTSEQMIRIQEGKKICLDCYSPYSRFDL